MKNIAIVATATRSSGALTIYNQFLSHLVDYSESLRCIIFVHPSMPQPPIDNVTYEIVNTERYFDRIMFDCFKCKQILQKKKISIDVVISLQNTGVRCLKGIKTVIYYHQGIPFYHYKCNLLDPYERVMAMYKYVYPFLVKNSIADGTRFVAQIPFMAKNIIKKYKINKDYVYVLPPDVESIDVDTINSYDKWDDSCSHFIYPATSYRYKNHKTIMNALGVLKHTLTRKIVVHFTIEPTDSPDILEMVERNDVSEMVDFMGVVPHDVLLSMYKSSDALLFPSVIETFGLPLVEASAFGIPILVSDMEYAHDVVGSYSGVRYIEPDNYKLWAKEMNCIVEDRKRYNLFRQEGKSSWDTFFEIVENL